MRAVLTILLLMGVVGGVPAAPAMAATPQFLTLPLASTKGMNIQQAWLWSGGSKDGTAGHDGIDYIRARVDSAPATWKSFRVVAAAPGQACASRNGRSACGFASRGNWVVMRHRVDGRTWYTFYGHLRTIDPAIPIGRWSSARLTRGQSLGMSGHSGDPCCITHLHFELLTGPGHRLDPYDLYARRERYPDPAGKNGRRSGHANAWITNPPSRAPRYQTGTRVPGPPPSSIPVGSPLPLPASPQVPQPSSSPGQGPVLSPDPALDTIPVPDGSVRVDAQASSAPSDGSGLAVWHSPLDVAGTVAFYTGLTSSRWLPSGMPIGTPLGIELSLDDTVGAYDHARADRHGRWSWCSHQRVAGAPGRAARVVARGRGERRYQSLHRAWTSWHGRPEIASPSCPVGTCRRCGAAATGVARLGPDIGGPAMRRRSTSTLLSSAALCVLMAMQGVVSAAAQSPAASDAPGPSASAGQAVVFAPPPPLVVASDTSLAADAALVPPELPAIDGIDLTAPWVRSRALVSGLPVEDWRTAALADHVDDDPFAAFAWVRDSIGFDPYAGELRGAAGTLTARSGDSLDRALLLQRLLDLMHVPSRLARGTLDDAAAAKLMQRAFTAPVKPLSAVALDERETGSLDILATRARRDYALLRGALGDRTLTMDGSGDAAALAAARDHWWVQMSFGTRWLDLDPSLPDAQPGDTLTVAQDTFDQVPTSDQQAVTVRVVAETLSSGQLSETTVLEQRLVAADAATSTIYLMFQPAVSGLGGTIDQVLGGSTSWMPALYMGPDPTLGSSFPITPGKDIFSDTTSDGPQLSRLTLEVAIDGPGQPSETHDSVLLDRVPPALRGSAHIDPQQLAPLQMLDGVPVDLVGIHHIQVSTGGFDARAHQLWRGVAARLARLELSDPGAAEELRFPFDMLPSAIGDETLVLTSEAFIRLAFDAEPGLRGFVARPRVYVSSMGPTGVPGQLSLRTDLMADGVRLISDGRLTPAELAARQVWYGALQTALETQVMDQRAMAVLTGPIAQTGTSQAMDQALTVLGPGDVARLPRGASPRLAADLMAGDLAVVPGRSRAQPRVVDRGSRQRCHSLGGRPGLWRPGRHGHRHRARKGAPRVRRAALSAARELRQRHRQQRSPDLRTRHRRPAADPRGDAAVRRPDGSGGRGAGSRGGRSRGRKRLRRHGVHHDVMRRAHRRGRIRRAGRRHLRLHVVLLTGRPSASGAAGGVSYRRSVPTVSMTASRTER